ncbi:MAG: lysozyme inhibitor LprI family protein, partial [bacterium]
MRVFPFVFILLCSGWLPVSAETAGDRYGGEYQTCRDGNTHDIVTCLSALYKKWDARVDAAYKKLLAMQADAKSRAALEQAQKSWLKFRDDNC